MQDEIRRVPRGELCKRLAAFRHEMDKRTPQWRIALINHKVNMYYFTGTMQDGVFAVTPDEATLWVRRSYERAKNESLFDDIRPMYSFRELAAYYGTLPKTVYIETKTATVDWLELLRRYLYFEETASVNPAVDALRLVKSSYELSLMRQAGEIHRIVLEESAPDMLRPGVTEAELAVNIYAASLRMGAQGVARFNLPLGEDVIGYASFGKSGLVRTAFDGPGGTGGTCVAVQSIGSAFRRLEPGRVVYLDIPCGIDGYHTDKSAVYYFGDLSLDPMGAEIKRAQEQCAMLEEYAASLLCPGMTPEDIYASAIKRLDSRYLDGFMNGGKFIGHSIGLTMDEAPALARGFKTPLQEGMAFALEPKIALPGVGVVGTENTYLVTASGGRSLTGNVSRLREICP